MREILVFGCFEETGQRGHRLHWSRLDDLPRETVRSIEFWIDARWEGPQQEGRATVRRQAGWLAIDWWDRQGDSRPGSHTAVIVASSEGLEPAELLERARVEVPWAFRVPVFFGGTEAL
jgi:hypothetical protein